MLSVALTLSCGGPDLSNSRSNGTARSPSPTPSELELSGVYNVEGAGENDDDPYKGILTVTNQEDIYKFEWQTNRSRHAGVGVQKGDAVAASYAESGDGEGCGVALYRITADGSLDGSIANWGQYTKGTETAKRIEGSTFEGKYQMSGTTNVGKAYDGTIEIKKNGMGYQFTWKISGRDSFGFGIWRGDRAAISFGGKQCFFALYQVQGARSLDGHWGGQKTVGFGTETAKRR
ncbi:MAG: hypothetical protein ABIV21_09360 [Pyrinomonadaceae bacterium]